LNPRHADFQSAALLTSHWSFLETTAQDGYERRSAVPHGDIDNPLSTWSHDAYFGTNSFGFSDPAPKKNFSISLTRNARALGSIGVRRFSLISVV
jgi:hypothetical protein